MECRQSSQETATTSPSLNGTSSDWADESHSTGSTGQTNVSTLRSLKDDTGHSDQRQKLSPSPVSQSLADRLKRLAATAWALEQDDDLSIVRRQHIENHLRHLETIIEDDTINDLEASPARASIHETRQNDTFEQRSSTAGKPDKSTDSPELTQIHDDLAVVVASMRLRQQEQQHLHQLTATKVEAVVQRCLSQERQIRNLVKGVHMLTSENKELDEKNNRLKDSIVEIESEASKREVAVNAMTSAVAGLEGWIDGADISRIDAHAVSAQPHTNQERRAVVRGKGRFRGRYYIDKEQYDNFVQNPDTQELQDGVRAWIRGFRDVEDAYSAPALDRGAESCGRGPDFVEEEDWGAFQSPVGGIP